MRVNLGRQKGEKDKDRQMEWQEKRRATMVIRGPAA